MEHARKQACAAAPPAPEWYYTRDRQRYDVILDNVLNRPPSATARLLTPRGVLIPNSIGNTGGLLAGLPRIARAMLMGLGRTTVKTATLTVNRNGMTPPLR